MNIRDHVEAAAFLVAHPDLPDYYCAVTGSYFEVLADDGTGELHHVEVYENNASGSGLVGQDAADLYDRALAVLKFCAGVQI